MVFLNTSQLHSEVKKSEKLLRKLPYWQVSQKLRLELKLKQLKHQLRS